MSLSRSQGRGVTTRRWPSGGQAVAPAPSIWRPARNSSTTNQHKSNQNNTISTISTICTISIILFALLAVLASSICTISTNSVNSA